MKRVIYSLAMLPFIAFGVKTIAMEEDASYPAQKRGYEALLLADATNQTIQNDPVRNSLSPMYQRVYDSMSPAEQQQVRDAFNNAQNGQESPEAMQAIDDMMVKEAMKNQQGITFEGSPQTLSPAMQADNLQPVQPDSPASKADSMNPQMPNGTNSETPAQKAARSNSSTNDMNW
jgi:hypothetical protein